jgi:hypothetical protein
MVLSDLEIPPDLKIYRTAVHLTDPRKIYDTRLPILLCKIINLARAPKRTVRYLRSRTIPHCEGRLQLFVVYLDLIRLKPGLCSFSNLQSGRNPTVRLAKWEILVQMSISSFFLIVW